MGAAPEQPGGIRGEMSKLYDIFVDWPGRLGREMPGVEKLLASVGARKVLDAGCGTGRHVQALLERGFDAHGADVSDEMLANAEVLLGGRERLHEWRLGDAPPNSVRAAAPFDAVLSMGNVWPQLAEPAHAEKAARAFAELLRPGGLLLLGLKALAVRRESGQPHMPLLKRRHAGQALWFVRFVDFDLPQPQAGAVVCDLHMAIVAGEAGTTPQALHHGATRVRAWAFGELREFFERAGFDDVRVHARIDERDSAPSGEDVYLTARRPA
jgi:SAM-dependent methyltransferase